MAIPLRGVSRKHCVVTRLRLIAARDLEAPDGRQPAFPLAFGRHSSPLRGPAPRSLAHFHRANSEAASIPPLTGSEAVTGCSEFLGSGKGSRHRERRENARLPAHLARMFPLDRAKRRGRLAIRSVTVLAEKQAAEIGNSVAQLGDCVTDTIPVVVLQLTGEFPLGQERGAVGANSFLQPRASPRTFGAATRNRRRAVQWSLVC
jgi:hypothetical protein